MRWRRLWLLILYSPILWAAQATAGELRLRWPVPCFQARADTCEYISDIPESTFAGQLVQLIRFSPPDTIDLPLIDETGIECRADSADFEILNGTMGEARFYGKDKAGNTSCGYASYLFAFPADSSWDQTPGLLGSYYSDKTLTSLVGTRIDPVIGFDWVEAAPFPGCPSDSFSVRWVGKLHVNRTGVHQFRLAVNDAARLWIGSTKIIDDWNTGDGWHNALASMALLANGVYDIKLEMKELWYISGAKLYWIQPGVAEELVPANAYTH